MKQFIKKLLFKINKELKITKEELLDPTPICHLQRQSLLSRLKYKFISDFLSSPLSNTKKDINFPVISNHHHHHKEEIGLIQFKQ